MIKQVTRRLRCEVQGCHKRADFALGTKGIDYPLCEAHAKDLFVEMNKLFGKEEKPNKIEVIEEVKEVKEVTEEVKAPEFFECKYCHQKFSKEEFSSSKFAVHVKACKKEHEVK